MASAAPLSRDVAWQPAPALRYRAEHLACPVSGRCAAGELPLAVRVGPARPNAREGTVAGTDRERACPSDRGPIARRCATLLFGANAQPDRALRIVAADDLGRGPAPQAVAASTCPPDRHAHAGSTPQREEHARGDRVSPVRGGRRAELTSEIPALATPTRRVPSARDICPSRTSQGIPAVPAHPMSCPALNGGAGRDASYLHFRGMERRPGGRSAGAARPAPSASSGAPHHRPHHRAMALTPCSQDPDTSRQSTAPVTASRAKHRGAHPHANQPP